MGRAPCCDKIGVKKGPWTPEEDNKLIQYIQTQGPGNWRSLPKNAGLQRCGKSCRLRWTNYLRPDIKRGRFTFEEEEAIIQLHSVLGNKWSAIAAKLPGRTDNEIKNYWNTHIRKRLLRNGIDPVTHRPRLDLLDLSSLLHNAGLINLSNLLGSQTLINPQLLSLMDTLSSLKQQNPALYSQMLQENQQHSISQACDSIPTSSLNNQPQQLVQSSNVTNYSFPTSQDISPSSLPQNFVSQQNYVNCSSDNTILEQSQLINLPSEINNFNHNFNQSPFTSTLSSNSTPLSSPSPFFNGSNEDEMASYCSSLLKFEIPEGLDISEFLQTLSTSGNCLV